MKLEINKNGVMETVDFVMPKYDKYHRDKDYLKFERHFRNIFKLRFKIIKRHVKNGRVLDVGTSTGAMLDNFKDDGPPSQGYGEERWETWGVELSGNYSIASKKGHKVFHGELESAKLPSGYFNVVIANHVLEHVEDPLVFLRKVKKVLKPSGVVLIDVPNFGGIRSRVYGMRWKYLTPEEHKWHFTKLSLSGLYKEVGLEVVGFESRSGLYEFGNPAAEMAQALTGRKKRFFTHFWHLPLDTVATALKMGDSFSLVGRKK